MKVILRGSDPERRHKISAAQGKEDANDLVIKHTCSGGGVMTGEVTISSRRHTLSGGAMTADEEMISS
jgi:hypothetical protein